MPGSGAGAAGDRVAARDERIGAVVDIEQRGLRAFAEDLPAGFDRVVDQINGVADIILQVVGRFADALPFGIDVERRDAVFGELLVVFGRFGAELLFEPLRPGQIDAPRIPVRFILSA